jgi:hypothetical protein
MGKTYSYETSHPQHPEYWENYILRNYHQRVTHNGKAKTLLKFGESDVVGTDFSHLWYQGGKESYVFDNLINTISSSSDNDTGIGVNIEYHTIDTATGDFSFAVQTVTLQGQTEVALPVPCARVSRAYNNSTVGLVGDVYIYETDTVISGVPQTAAKIHAKIEPVTVDQSQKCSTTISSVDWWVITDVFLGVSEKAAAWAEGHLLFRDAKNQKVFRPLLHLTASDEGPAVVQLATPILIPSNCDVVMAARANAANTSVLGFMGGFLLTNTDGQR